MVTLLMPIRNEASHLQLVLDSIAKQTFAHRKLRLIALDGLSDDQSVAIVRTWLADSDIDGIVLSNHKQTIPAALNLGLSHTEPNSYAVRLDSHTIYPPNYVAEIVRVFEHSPPDVACIGGPQRVLSPRTFTASIIASLYESAMGLGPADVRSAAVARFVDSVYLGAWRPGVAQRLGGYDEAWLANEDAELAARARASGLKILQIPLASDYIPKRSLVGTIRQWGRYGSWRVRTLARYPGSMRLRHLAPPIAVIFGTALILSPIRFAALPLYFFYLVLIVRARPRHESPLVTAACGLFFPICQAAYGLGMLAGVARLLRRGVGSKPASIEPTISPGEVGA